MRELPDRFGIFEFLEEEAHDLVDKASSLCPSLTFSCDEEFEKKLKIKKKF